MNFTHSLVSDIGLAITAASIFGLLFNKLRIPLMAAYIAAGALLGDQFGLGLISNNENIETLSEIGFILLMFILGFDIDPRRMLYATRAVIFSGMTQVIFTMAATFLAFNVLLFSFSANPLAQFYLAMSLSLSSTLVVIKTLSERHELDHLSSRITVGIAIVQDLWAISFLAFQQSFESFQVSIFFWSFGKLILLGLVAFPLSRYILPRFFKSIEDRPELLVISAVAWCFAMSTFSHSLKISKEMGALIAGIAMATLPYAADITSKVSNLRDFFVTLFFVSLGLRLPMPNGETFLFVGFSTVLIFATRFLSVPPFITTLKYGRHTAFITALNLSQLSEFSLVLIALGMKYGHIPSALMHVITWTFVITALISAILIPQGDNLYKRINNWMARRGLAEEEEPLTEEHATRKFKMTLIGFHQQASSLLNVLEDRFSKSYREQIQILDDNVETIRKLKSAGFEAHYVDFRYLETLSHFNLENSEIILSTNTDILFKGTSNLKLLQKLKKVAPRSHLLMTAQTITMAKELYAHGANYVIQPRFVGARFIADTLERIEAGHIDFIRESSLKYLAEQKEILS